MEYINVDVSALYKTVGGINQRVDQVTRELASTRKAMQSNSDKQLELISDVIRVMRTHSDALDRLEAVIRERIQS